MRKPSVNVEIVPQRTDEGIETGKQQAVVTDRSSGRAWSGEGDTTSEAATEAVRKFIGDRRAREYME